MRRLCAAFILVFSFSLSTECPGSFLRTVHGPISPDVLQQLGQKGYRVESSEGMFRYDGKGAVLHDSKRPIHFGASDPSGSAEPEPNPPD
jgi:hypothetical protein